MPKKTFLNLQPAKQRNIVYSALLEFTNKGYSQGSIGTIAEYAKVAKGSFYQYFEDKLDFYIYLTDYTYSLLLTAIQRKSTALLDEKHSVAELFEHMGEAVWSIIDNYPAELCFICSSRKEQEKNIQDRIDIFAQKFEEVVLTPFILQTFGNMDSHCLKLYLKAFVLLFLEEMSERITVSEEVSHYTIQLTRQEWQESYRKLLPILLSGII